MRRYIRHPSTIPINFSVDESNCPSASSSPCLKDVSVGGLCFNSEKSLTEGTPIHLEIPLSKDFEADGVVSWCRKEGDHYAVGVEFVDEPTQFSVKMVEQVCYIEQYRKDMNKAGRCLSSEQAAKEWIDKYAADFAA